ncbi:MAG: 4Fe-4S double cluster binding domain-containing protein [Candidatus Odinarchaeota archaeon]
MNHQDQLWQSLSERGYQIRVVSAEHVPILQTEIKKRLQQDEFDREFYKTRLSWFDFQPPKKLQHTRSVIVAALPRPQTQAIFTWNGRRRILSLPPTYTDYDKITQQVSDDISMIVAQLGHKISKTKLPLKLLAARSGLTQYGRNNICYVPKMGSYLQLVAVYSDMPCQEDSWQEPTMMTACKSCELCRKACPTMAIPTDRFLLRAERCIVFHNEKPGNIPFPAWMKTSWHNCVVGCLRCQRVCPLNKEFVRLVGGKEEFSEEETALFLKGISAKELPTETLNKLKRLSLDEYYGALHRNLGVFFKKT